MKRREGKLAVYTGASRQGKTAAVKQRIRNDRRVIVWSVKEAIDRYANVWPDTVRARTPAELLAAIKTHATRPARLVYLPSSMKDFGWWARCAYTWGKCAACTVVAEEIADVTSPGKAPEAWGILVRQGLGWGIDIYAVTQRPAESDKTVMGNATFFHCHAMSRAKDRKYMAEEMDVDVAELAALKQLEWIQRWNTGAVRRGTLRF